VHIGTDAGKIESSRRLFEATGMRTVLATLLILVPATAHAADPPAVAKLVRALQHKDGTKRLHAAADLGELGAKAKAALPALTKALDDPHPIVRFYAAEAIGKVGETLTPALKARLMKVVKTDKSWIVARQAALSLERLDPKGPIAESLLSQWPGNGPPMTYLVKFKPRFTVLPVKSTTELLRMLVGKDDETVVAAMLLLDGENRIDKQRLARNLIPLLNHPVPRVRRVAAAILSARGPDGATAVAVAEDALRSGSTDLIRQVSKNRRVNGELTARVLDFIQRHPKVSRRIRRAAKVALFRQMDRTLTAQRAFVAKLDREKKAIGGQSFDLWKAAEETRLELRTGSTPLRVQTLWKLTQFRWRARRFSKDIAELLTTRDSDLFESAVATLVAIGPEWRTVSSVFRKLLRSSEQRIRQQGIDALLRMKRVRKHALSDVRLALTHETRSPQKLSLLRLARELSASDAALLTTCLKLVETDADPHVRAEAAKSIRDFAQNARDAVKPLFAALETERNATVKLQIALAIDHCVKPQSRTHEVLRKLIVEYSRQVAIATLRDVIRRQDELAKDVQRQNLWDLLELKP
jgi:HEAT repeats